MILIRQRCFSKKEDYREKLKGLDYEDLQKEGFDKFGKAVGHSIGTVISGAAATSLIKNGKDLVKRGSKKDKILGSAAYAAGVITGLNAGAHAKEAISNGRGSRMVKLENRKRNRDKKSNKE